MSTAIQKANPTQMTAATDNALQVRVALNQNLWGMEDPQVWDYYKMMCQHLKLDPASKPFDIISDPKQQRKVLYPNTSCTSQLGDRERLSYGKMETDVNPAMLQLGFKVVHVSVEVRHPNGRTLVAEAFVDLMSGWEGKALSGANLVNALKKAGTQCRRRGTLQMLGLAAPSDDVPTVKLGDIERTDEEIEGVVIEHPPLSALTEGESEPTAAEKLQAEISELIDAFKDSGGDDKKIASEIKRQLTAFDAVRISELDAEQLQELKDGLSFWLNSQKVTA